MELELEEVEASASEDELATEQTAARTTTVNLFTRKRPSRKPFMGHLPRERVVILAPEVCACCGSERLCKLGEDITETLEGAKHSATRPTAVQGGPDGAREFQLPGLREDHSAASALPRGPAGLGGAEPPGYDPVREVWPA